METQAEAQGLQAIPPPSSSRNGVRAKRRTAYPGSMPRRTSSAIRWRTSQVPPPRRRRSLCRSAPPLARSSRSTPSLPAARPPSVVASRPHLRPPSWGGGQPAATAAAHPPTPRSGGRCRAQRGGGGDHAAPGRQPHRPASPGHPSTLVIPELRPSEATDGVSGIHASTDVVGLHDGKDCAGSAARPGHGPRTATVRHRIACRGRRGMDPGHAPPRFARRRVPG